MDRSPKCLKCGGTDLKDGRLFTVFLMVEGIALLVDGGSSLSSKKDALPLEAAICLECGFVAFACDPKAARAVAERIVNGPTAEAKEGRRPISGSPGAV